MVLKKKKHYPYYPRDRYAWEIPKGKKRKKRSRWKGFGRRGKRKIPRHIASFISKKISKLMSEGYTQQQAIRIAYDEARIKYPRVKGLKR